jgi:hypothetical protein
MLPHDIRHDRIGGRSLAFGRQGPRRNRDLAEPPISEGGDGAG